ncbi:hypothetical protein IWX90DRAFT_418397 [Phyllosticta citrichinensis]|uniref:Secreted protein n=1 Tax=Phyllosticta citrichinensis TaxID=1130410 RepID=A0ABR1XIT0_9PEZI
MAMHRVSAISFVLALAAVLLGTKVFGAPTGEGTYFARLLTCLATRPCGTLPVPRPQVWATGILVYMRVQVPSALFNSPTVGSATAGLLKNSISWRDYSPRACSSLSDRSFIFRLNLLSRCIVPELLILPRIRRNLPLVSQFALTSVVRPQLTENALANSPLQSKHTQNVHLEARDTPQSGPNFEPVQDKPLLVPRAPVPEADADANADADAEADPDIWSHPDQNCPDPRDAGLDLGWPIISCEDGRRKRFLKKDPDADLDSLDDDLAERV